MPTAQSVLFKMLQVMDPKTKALSAFGQVLNQVGYQDASQALIISAATNANPVQITAAGHGYITGDPVFTAGCTGNTAPNNTTVIPFWPVTKIDVNNFTIPVAGNGAYNGNSGTVTKALVGSVDGAKFSRQRQLDIYNFARKVLLRNMVDLWKDNVERVKNEIGSMIVVKPNVTFAASGVDTQAPVPADYIEFIAMIDAANANAKKNSIDLLPPSMLQSVLKGLTAQSVQSASRRFVFLLGGNFVNPNGLIAAAATYVLYYYGLTDFSFADILGNTVVETIPFPRHGALLELALAIADEKSMKDINKLAAELIGKAG